MSDPGHLWGGASTDVLAIARADFQAGRIEQAMARLQARPDDPRCQAQLGAWLYQAHRRDAARAAYTRAHALAPHDADIAYNLGGICQMANDLPAALQALTRAVHARPQFHDALTRLAVVQAASGHHAAAGESFDAALACPHPSAYAYRQWAQWLLTRARPTEALRALDAASALAPETAFAAFLRGCALHATGALADAAAAFEHSLSLNPSSVECRYNLATLYKDLGRLDLARHHYAEVLQRQPHHTSALLNQAWVLEELGDLPAAIACCTHLLDHTPDHAKAHVNLACLLARQGDLGAAWPHWEWRFSDAHGDDRVHSAPPATTAPCWTGGSLQGKHVLIWPEQGFGDVIQFCRYAVVLKARGAAAVTLAAPAPLSTLLAGLAGVDRVVTATAPLPDDIDVWCWLMSLPWHLGTQTLADIPAAVPYLSAPAEARARMQDWVTRVVASAPASAAGSTPPPTIVGRRIGLVWRGNPAHRNDAQRSLPSIETLVPLVDAAPAGTVFVNLQFRDDTAALGATPLARPEPAIASFADAAAVIEHLDLVICVDTATAHLAAALGCPTWVLLPAQGTDWRWLTDRTDSPWYPAVMRLFRQAPEQTWSSVVADVAQALAQGLSTEVPSTEVPSTEVPST